MTAATAVAKEQKQQHISPSGANNNGDDQNDDDGYVRLHVTPLDAELLGVVVPQSVLPRARNVSYHALETFPERRYGFVELPRQDADKLRAKLHGATLRGHKMRVEKARPEARAAGPRNDGEEEGEDDTVRAEKRKKEKKERKKSKKSRNNDEDGDKDGAELGVDADLGGTSRKRKRDHNVVDGVALTDRKVKRGWSETADAAAPKKQRRDKKSDSKDKEARKKDRQEKKRVRSKYTEGEECLLKMKAPPGSAAAARDLLPEEDVVSKKKRKSKGKDREVTIHEFERTSKFPSFLKNAAGPADGAKGAAAEFVEGKGWVDDEGNVVEAVSLNKPPPRPAKKPKKRAPTPEPVVEEEDDDETSSSGTSSSGESDDEDEEIPVPVPAPAPEKKKKKKQQPEPQQPVADDSSDTSSSDPSDTSSSEDDDEEETPSSTAKASHKTPSSATAKPEAARPVSSSSSRSLTIKIPPATPSGKAVHPLEALYKRDKNADGTQAAPEPFSFFGGDVDEDDDVDDEEQGDEGPPTRLRTPMPMTPFTKQEFERRIVRSAAPTPDTAHPSRMANFWPAYEAGADGEADDDDDADADMADEDDGQDADAPADKSASDFQSWFWENRRDLNRSWMSRRKSAAKEKRHRENKARASRAV